MLGPRSIAWLAFAISTAICAASAQSTPPAIQVVDEQSRRGVPLVELRTTSNVSFFTDSAGYAAIDDPAMLGHRVYFFISSDGYDYPADGFGQRGISIDLKAGERTVVRLKRLNIAERLYRLTGEGIYRDSVMLGKVPPIQNPLLDAQVTGQDSVQNVVYRDKVYWFWGDTQRQSYALGHFGTACATSSLPQSGGLDPSVGVDLQYLTDADGFSRPVFPEPADHPRWTDGLVAVAGDGESELLLARVSIMKSLEQCLQRKLVRFDDSQQRFVDVAPLPLDGLVQPSGHATVVTTPRGKWIYFCNEFPDLRCRADLPSIKDLRSYEAFTCLKPGSHYEQDRTLLERDAAGHMVWGWKRGTDPLRSAQVQALTRSGLIQAAEAWFAPRDVQGGEPVQIASSSFAYNPFRKRWVMIGVQLHGSSSELGEVWYSEADQPEGPWSLARKVITHRNYSFYNPAIDAFFQQDGGRLLYFEGTYSITFSGNSHPTPRYDYNQMMYRLDLADPRLELKPRP